MSFKSKVGLALSVTGLVTGAMWYLEPKSDSEQVRRDQVDQQVQDLQDSQDAVDERRRAESYELGETTRRDQLKPSEVRPHEGPKIRVRIP